jgi:hypothetical protein
MAIPVPRRSGGWCCHDRLVGMIAQEAFRIGLAQTSWTWIPTHDHGSKSNRSKPGG